MSDEALTPAASGSDKSANSGLTAGAMLRQAREASGLHVAALAVAMKVPVKKLEALEADRWDQLPDSVFVRGLASSVCRALKINPGPVLEKLPQSAAPRLDTEARGINTPFHSTGPSPLAGVSAYISKPAVLVVFGLLLAALVVIFFPESHTTSNVTTATADPILPQAQGSAVFASEPIAVASASAAVASTPAAVVSVPVSLAVPPAAVATVAASAPAQTLTASSPPAVPAAAASVPKASASALPAQSSVSSPLVSGSIGFTARGKSWVEVVDARKVVLIRRALGAGEKVELSGALPLSVVVGAADMVAVEVRGKPFSLDQIAITNVARFEVK